MRILITGADGFIGSHLSSLLDGQGHQLLLATRGAANLAIPSVAIGNIDTFDGWDTLLADIDIVIHLAARALPTSESHDEVVNAYKLTNCEASARLARSAVKSGVRRFIFLSSIKVNGEETLAGHAFQADDLPAPIDVYGKSKLQAEKMLQGISSGSNMGLVIIRPPLVYGPDVKANFLSLLELAQGGMPLPFSGLTHCRDMVSIDNLCDLISCCIDNPHAAGETLMVSDGIAYSIPDIIRSVRSITGLPQRLFYFPPSFLRWLLILLGKNSTAARLFSSLQIDISATTKTLGWVPEYTLEQTLKKMCH